MISILQFCHANLRPPEIHQLLNSLLPKSSVPSLKSQASKLDGGSPHLTEARYSNAAVVSLLARLTIGSVPISLQGPDWMYSQSYLGSCCGSRAVFTSCSVTVGARCSLWRNLFFTESLRRPTVEAKVDVLAVEAVSTSFAGLTALIFGEAGWNHEGGFSLGYSFRGQFTIARARD